MWNLVALQCGHAKARVDHFDECGNGPRPGGAGFGKGIRVDERVEQVVHEDALKYTNKLFRDFYSKLYMQLVREAPTVLGWVYRATDEPWKGEAARVQLDRLNLAPLVKFIKEFDPHITVCTHFLPAGIISHLIDRGDLETHHSIVVTDLDCHAMWLSRIFHRYFVALDETKVHLEALGLPAERISATGIPSIPCSQCQSIARRCRLHSDCRPASLRSCSPLARSASAQRRWW
jgi:processive 1,2-diacylglycerol beta-glucosyltransferase